MRKQEMYEEKEHFHPENGPSGINQAHQLALDLVS